MSHSQGGYQVAILGASSLSGKELQNILRERLFSVAGVATLGIGTDHWIWAVADNVRISARNAVKIAESLIPQREK